MKTIRQFYRFTVVGVVNTIIDVGVLNLLMWFSGVTAGTLFSLLKAFSFLAAVGNSYILNKVWTFGDKKERNAFQVSQFLVVSVGGLAVNVFVASLIVNYIHPVSFVLDWMDFGFSLINGGVTEAVLWANFATLVAVATSMIWNFVGCKFFVFSDTESGQASAE